MKKLKLSLTVFLGILLCLFSLSNFVKIEAKDAFITEAGGGGQYYVEETITNNNLPYGIKHYTDLGMTSTDVATSMIEEDGVFQMEPNTFYSQQVNVLEVPSTEGVKLVNWSDFSNHIWNRRTVKEMALDYEEKNPGWKVIGAINGDFFDINSRNNLGLQTEGAVLSNGNYYKTTSKQTLGFKNDGSTNSVVVGQGVQRSQYMKLDIYDENDNVIKTFDIEKLNTEPGLNETSIYFATYNQLHEIVPVAVNSNSANAYFVDAELALPNNEKDFYGSGTINSTKDKTISVGEFAIVTNNQELTNYLNIGVKIRTQYVFTEDFKDVNSVMGFNGIFLEGGKYFDAKNSTLDARHPRTIVGFKENGTIVMAVVDGRQRSKGFHGVVGDEMAAIMKRYGCVAGYNLDGGGSSTLIIRQNDEFIVTNSPSDGEPRKDSNCLLIVAKDPNLNYETTNISTNVVDLNININDRAEHDIQKIYAQLGSVTKEVIDNKVSFDRLRFNTKYQLSFSYQDKNGNIISLKDNKEILTLKRPYSFDKLNIIEDENQFTIIPQFRDIDGATNIPMADVIINDKIFKLNDGKIIVSKFDIGDKITKIEFKYTFNYNLGDNFVSILNPNYYSTMFLNIIIENNNNCILEIYN